jgi:hypothetical protein
MPLKFIQVINFDNRFFKKIVLVYVVNSVTFIVVEFKIVEVRFLYIPRQANI